MLSKSITPKKVIFEERMPDIVKPGEEIVKVLSSSSTQKPKPMSQQEINQRLNLILSEDD